MTCSPPRNCKSLPKTELIFLKDITTRYASIAIHSAYLLILLILPGRFPLVIRHCGGGNFGGEDFLGEAFGGIFGKFALGVDAASLEIP